MYRSIPHLIENTTSLHGPLTAFSLKVGFRTKTYTYQQVFEYIKKFPAFFEKHHIKSGDTIIILSHNKPEYAMLILGALSSGVTIVPIDYRTNHETIVKFVTATKPKAIFTSRIYTDLFHAIHSPLFLFEELLPEIETVASNALSEQNPNQLAAILFTSGTTGEPKGTMITYKNILASVNGIVEIFKLPRTLRLLSILPLSHALEMFGGLMSAYAYGCHIHYLERINSITLMQALKRYHIQAMAVVPQMLRLLLQSIERKVEEEHKEQQWNTARLLSTYLPRSLKRLLFRKVHENLGGSFSFFVCGSAPLEVKISQLWEGMGVIILEGYGASETTGIVSTNTLTDLKQGTVGKILPHIQHKINDAGELLVSGDNIVSGYFHNEEKTQESFQNGWFHTGDIVSLGNDGYLRIVGRDKFKIVLPDGKKVYPEDIEKKLNNNPLVIDSAVFGLKTHEGEIVHAEIITKHKDKVKTIVTEVNSQLNPHEQILDFGVWPQDDFPRTKTLKVDRQAVQNAIQATTSEKGTHQQIVPEKQDKLASIISLVSGQKHIGETMVLATDLKFDSLKRIELLALIEEEMGISVEEMKITPQTSVADLRELVSFGKPVVLSDGEKLNEWQFNPIMGNVRVFLQDYCAFPLMNLGIKVRVIHPHNIQKMQTPQLFIFNHVGMYDIIQILRILPSHIRKKTTIAATSDIWHSPFYHRMPAEIFANAFPFVKAEVHRSMRGNFERVGQLLDLGYNIMISPEGNISPNGELLPFHTGAGYIAVEMGVPVVPFKIQGYFDLWPEDQKRKLNLYWPKKFGAATVIVGEPLTFTPGTSYEKATDMLRDSLANLT